MNSVWLDTLPSIHYNARVAWKNKSDAAEKERFAQEAMTHLDHLYRVAVHLTKENSEAKDLVQEAYLRALESSDQYADGTNMKAWLTKILYNFFVDRYHDKKRWVHTEDRNSQQGQVWDHWETMATDNPGPEKYLLAKELNHQITEALRKIPEEFRNPLVLVDMGDFTYAEAAEILSCPVGTIRSRLSRGRRVLYRQLVQYIDRREKRKEQK